MPSVFVKTLGCKVNTFDSNALANQLSEHGCTLTDQSDHADIVVVNTCSVTANAEKEARYLARRYKRENPGTHMVLTGCYAQTDSASLAQLEDVDFIVPNEVKSDAARLITKSFAQGGGIEKLPPQVSAVSKNRQGHFKSSLTLFDRADSQRTRAFVKVQDGCNGFCTYCLIPYARGASTSVPPRQVVAEVKRLGDAGVPEIVLTGIHIGDWGRDLEQYKNESRPVVRLLEDLLSAHDTVRFRISSLEPRELSQEMITLMAAHKDRFCEHFHLPLQSGCDRILKLMGREYDTAKFRESVKLIRDYFPEACIGTDVIPGFPGESNEEHEESMRFVEELNLSYLHVFPYSRRPNTAANRMPRQHSKEVINARAADLRKLSRELSHNYAAQFINREVLILWENDTDQQGRRKGRTANYLSVVASADTSPHPGTFNNMSLKGFVDSDQLLASPTL